MSEVISHEHPEYVKKWRGMTVNQFNGAYYYSREIVANIIPRVKTERAWVTINVPGACRDRAIVFVHNNKNPGMYNWLAGFRDLVLVCGVEQTARMLGRLHRTIVLPLSVDVEEVKKFRREKDRESAYVGRYSKQMGMKLPRKCDKICDLPREELLKEMARYRKVYAVGRCAIEARILGAEIGYFDPRYPDVSLWQVLDNRDAAKILQIKLDEIDKGRR